MTCTHKHYKQGGYMTSRRALKAIHSGEMYYMSKIIRNCDKCGADIKWARIVRVATKEQEEEFSKWKKKNIRRV